MAIYVKLNQKWNLFWQKNLFFSAWKIVQKLIFKYVWETQKAIKK
jgi:hypothetical protein